MRNEIWDTFSFCIFIFRLTYTFGVVLCIPTLIFSWARGLVWDEGWGLGMSNDWDDNEWMGG